MTEPHGSGPMGPEEELAALAGLDLALDELAAGRDVPTGPVGGGTAALASLAAELRAAVPPPPPGAAERGRAAFLARAGGGRARGTTWRRPLPLRLAAAAAALVVVVALPAAARQARPGTALWPVREAGQQVRDRLADDPVQRARLRLNTAASYLAAGRGAGGERGKDMADRAEGKVKDALDDVAGPEAAAQRARARQLLAQVEALRHERDAGGRSGAGSGSVGGSSGPGGGGGDPAGDDRSGRGGGSGSGGGSGNSASGSVSGSGSSGSRRSGSGHG